MFIATRRLEANIFYKLKCNYRGQNVFTTPFLVYQKISVYKEQLSLFHLYFIIETYYIRGRGKNVKPTNLVTLLL